MGVIGALDNLGKAAKSLGRDMFGLEIKSNPKIAKIAEGAGVTLDTLETAPLEDLSAILDRAARQRLIDPRFANSINIQIAKDAQEAVPDNVASFADAQSDQMVSKIKGVLEDMPYTMNLPYEIGQKLNSEGRLPLPIGTNMMPPSGKGRPEDVYKISGYKADPNNLDVYGYEITSREGDVSYIGVSDPKMGIKEKRPDMVAGWKAALGPQGSERLDYTPPDWQRTETPRIVRTPEDQNAIDQQYNDLFGTYTSLGSLPKDAQEAVPASSSDFFEAMGDEGALTEFSGIGNLIDTYVYENSQQALKDAMSDPDYNVYLDVLKTNLNKTFPSGKIPVRRAENYLTKRPEENLSNEYKTINAKDISFASNISENEVIVKEGDKFTSYFIDNALPKDTK